VLVVLEGRGTSLPAVPAVNGERRSDAGLVASWRASDSDPPAKAPSELGYATMAE
jgi:hypothetical protein